MGGTNPGDKRKGERERERGKEREREMKVYFKAITFQAAAPTYAKILPTQNEQSYQTQLTFLLS